MPKIGHTLHALYPQLSLPLFSADDVPPRQLAALETHVDKDLPTGKTSFVQLRTTGRTTNHQSCSYSNAKYSYCLQRKGEEASEK